mmetsp:Transcript_40361/g.89620  ORF Transcript_40361/g.89620 Transcript_40361/m.89620 type:complete len:302 (-) Transcript_40361:384-1289(-)
MQTCFPRLIVHLVNKSFLDPIKAVQATCTASLHKKMDKRHAPQPIVVHEPCDLCILHRQPGVTNYIYWQLHSFTGGEAGQYTHDNSHRRPHHVRPIGQLPCHPRRTYTLTADPNALFHCFMSSLARISPGPTLRKEGNSYVLPCWSRKTMLRESPRPQARISSANAKLSATARSVRDLSWSGASVMPHRTPAWKHLIMRGPFLVPCRARSLTTWLAAAAACCTVVLGAAGCCAAAVVGCCWDGLVLMSAASAAATFPESWTLSCVEGFFGSGGLRGGSVCPALCCLAGLTFLVSRLGSVFR